MPPAKSKKRGPKRQAKKQKTLKNSNKQLEATRQPQVSSTVIFCHNGVCVKKSTNGMGTFATKRIPANTVMLKEKPHALDEPRSPEYAFKLIRRLIDNPATKPQLESLVPLSLDPADEHRVAPYSDLEEGHRKYLPELTPEQMRLMHAKLMRNWFSLGDRPGILFTGTRMNHSCNPNVRYSMDGDHMVFRTARPIRKNEEIFDSYISGELPYAERQAELQRRYGFQCGCDKCKKQI